MQIHTETNMHMFIGGLSSLPQVQTRCQEAEQRSASSVQWKLISSGQRVDGRENRILFLRACSYFCLVFCFYLFACFWRQVLTLAQAGLKLMIPLSPPPDRLKFCVTLLGLLGVFLIMGCHKTCCLRGPSSLAHPLCLKGSV